VTRAKLVNRQVGGGHRSPIAGRAAQSAEGIQKLRLNLDRTADEGGKYVGGLS